ncbi:MAG: hypothetical protein ACK4TA_22905 [Saprospiraceae bacterium]
MKSIIFTSLFSFMFIQIACAQITQNTENTYALPESRKVTFDLPFARKINVKTWDKKEVLLKTKLTADNEEVAKLHEMRVIESNGSLLIKTDYADTGEKNRNICGCNDDKNRSRWNCICLEVSHEIFLPANTVLNMETINGDIEVRGLQGDIHLETINGFIDIAYSPQAQADIEFSTINGDIYTDFDINKKGNLTKYSKDIKTQLNGGGPDLELETINGDIFFRKN